MPVFVSMLRGINVGGHKRIGMEALTAAYADCGLGEARTLLQSGNVVFATKATDEARLAARIEAALAAAFGFPVDVILRSAAELGEVIGRNPYRAEAERAPSRLLVLFLRSPLADAVVRRLGGHATDDEKLVSDGREVFMFFGQGAGRSKLAQSLEPRHLGGPATTRNWNTLTRLAAMAEDFGRQ